MIFLKVMPFSWDKYYPSSVGAHGGCGRSGGFISLFICVLD